MPLQQFYTIAGNRVSVFGDIWTIPCLVDVGGGLLESSECCLLIDGGAICNARSGLPCEIVDNCGPLMGWGKQSCDRSYSVDGIIVSADLLEGFAKIVGVALPLLAESRG